MNKYHKIFNRSTRRTPRTAPRVLRTAGTADCGPAAQHWVYMFFCGNLGLSSRAKYGGAQLYLCGAVPWHPKVCRYLSDNRLSSQ